jgi:hypothetical protein
MLSRAYAVLLVLKDRSDGVIVRLLVASRTDPRVDLALLFMHHFASHDDMVSLNAC